jgi:hypothetical protein
MQAYKILFPVFLLSIGNVNIIHFLNGKYYVELTLCFLKLSSTNTPQKFFQSISLCEIYMPHGFFQTSLYIKPCKIYKFISNINYATRITVQDKRRLSDFLYYHETVIINYGWN